MGFNEMEEMQKYGWLKKKSWQVMRCQSRKKLAFDANNNITLSSILICRDDNSPL